MASFTQARKMFHASLLKSVLCVNEKGVVSNADSSNPSSRKIAAGIAELLKLETIGERLAAQTSGNQFEIICAEFIRQTFLKLGHIRPGNWDVSQVSKRDQLEIAKYQQYSHLRDLDQAARNSPVLAAALGNDYTISPDIVVARLPESNPAINRETVLIDSTVSRFASLREDVSPLPFLHASISCKWTIRSDRAQNARSEALNLIRNRKGRLPHIVVITAEPTPSRLSSIALGTGDIDCVYHFALHELQQTLVSMKMDKARDILGVMVEGRRLKDISDLPLDLAV